MTVRAVVPPGKLDPAETLGRASVAQTAPDRDHGTLEAGPPARRFAALSPVRPCRARAPRAPGVVLAAQDRLPEVEDSLPEVEDLDPRATRPILVGPRAVRPAVDSRLIVPPVRLAAAHQTCRR